MGPAATFSNRLIVAFFMFALASSQAKDVTPDQRSIDSLLRVIDNLTAVDYLESLRFIDSTLSATKERPAFATQYLFVKMKKSSVLLRAKAHSKAFQNLLDIESTVSNHPDVLVKAMYQVMTAFIYGDQGNFNKALECYHEALEYYEQYGQPRKIALTYNNMADCYLAMGEAQQALREISKALQLYKEHSFEKPNVIYSTAGEIELQLGNYEKALSYFNHALRGSNLSGFQSTNLYMAQTLIGLKQFEKAKWHIDLSRNGITNDLGIELIYYLTVVDYFKAIHHFDSALKYNEKAFQLSQKLAQRKSNEEVEIVRLSEHYENENLLLRQQVEAKSFQQKLYLIILLLSGLAVGFLIYSVIIKRRDYRRLINKNHEIADQAEKLKALSEELTAQGEVLQRTNEILEAQVTERTAKLSAKNERLTKYAFFNAHRLRSPIATLLGLKQLMLSNSLSPDRETIVEHIFATTERFDEVVKEMQQLLHDIDDDELASVNLSSEPSPDNQNLQKDS